MPESRLRQDRVGRGIAAMLLAVFCFSVADAIAKWQGESGFAAAQIVFFRYLFGLIPVGFLLWGEGLKVLRTERPWVHALRAAMQVVALVSLFAGLRVLPLPEAIAITFTTPLFVTAFSGPFLGEAVGLRRWLAVIVGFFGTVIVVQPGSEAFQAQSLLILASALCFALIMLLTRKMARTETNLSMLTYSTVGAGLVSLPFAAWDWQPATGLELGLFLTQGLVGGMAAYWIIIAYRNAPAAVVAPFTYTALIWASLFGWLIWQDQLGVNILIGAAVIVVSNLYILQRERVRGRP